MEDDVKHSLRRTSPKGPGSPFTGTCVNCGKQNVTNKQFFDEDCPNMRGVTEDEALIEAIMGDDK